CPVVFSDRRVRRLGVRAVRPADRVRSTFELPCRLRNQTVARLRGGRIQLECVDDRPCRTRSRASRNASGGPPLRFRMDWLMGDAMRFVWPDLLWLLLLVP